jgi:hypothetical protein
MLSYGIYAATYLVSFKKEIYGLVFELGALSDVPVRRQVPI